MTFADEETHISRWLWERIKKRIARERERKDEHARQEAIEKMIRELLKKQR